MPISASGEASRSASLLLVVEDDDAIARPLQFGLQQEGFRVVRAANGREALEQAQKVKPHLVLLDVMLPEMDGYEVCRRLRRETNVPIIMLTARGQELERVFGLEIGADDYVVKPFSFRELVARIRIHLRRSGNLKDGEMQSRAIAIGDIRIDPDARQVWRKGQPVELSRREFDLLLALMERSGQALSRQELLDLVWGESWVGTPRTLDVHIRWLREKLEDDPSQPRYLETVYGYGYRFKAD